MPRKTKAEVIADLEAKLAEAKASEDKSKLTKIEKLKAAITTLDERIAKLQATKQGKLDEVTLIERELTDDEAAESPAESGVTV